MKKRIFLILAIVCCIFGITGCTKKQNKSPKKQQKDVNGFFNTEIKVYKGKYYKIGGDNDASSTLCEIDLEKFKEKELVQLKNNVQEWEIQNSKLYYITYEQREYYGLYNAKAYVCDIKNKKNTQIANLGDCINISMENGYVFAESEISDENTCIKKYDLKKKTEKTIYKGKKHLIELSGYNAYKKNKGIIKGDNGQQIATDYYVYPMSFFRGHSIYYLYFDGTNNYVYQIDLNKYEKTKKVNKELVFKAKKNYAFNLQGVAQDYILYTNYKNIRDLRIHSAENILGTEINVYDIKNKKNTKYTLKYPNKEQVVNWTPDEVITTYSIDEKKQYMMKYDAKHPDGYIILKEKDEAEIVDYINQYCNGKCIEQTSLFNISSNEGKNEKALQKYLVSDDILEGTWECKDKKMKISFKKDRKAILNGEEFNYTYPRQVVKEMEKDDGETINGIRIYSKRDDGSIKVKQDIVVTNYEDDGMVVFIDDKYYVMEKIK